MKKPTTAIVLDTRRPFNKKNGNASLYPVKLRVTFEGKQKYYAIEKFSLKPTDFLLNAFSLSKADFEKAKGEKPRDIHKDRRLLFDEIESRAMQIAFNIPKFTFQIFERHYFSSESDIQNVYAAYNRCIERLKKEGRVGNAIAYECSLQSLEKYTGRTKKENGKKIIASGVKLKFSDIDLKWLQDYERKMISDGSSLNTIGIYIRCLRSLFNDAISVGALKQESYPFGKRKYQIPSAKGKKKALQLSEIEKLYLHHQDNSSDTERRSLDLWLFSYLCNGMNIADIARLRFKNISDGKLTFNRKKTEHTSRKDLKSITVMITPRMQEIIERWGTAGQLPDNYVFPILHAGITAMGEKDKVRQAIKTINKYVKRIAEELQITKAVTTYTARHSFATVLKRKGISTEIISESLGHSDLKTTEAYLDSFEDETRREISTHLTNFSNEKSSSHLKAVK